MKFLRSVSILASLLCTFSIGKATTIRVLFLGNSYTGVNDLPHIISDIALSNNDSLVYDSYTPGGYTLQNHFGDATSLAKINQGNWDYVVLQEQSQLPSFPIGQVQISVYPYAHKLDSLINAVNPCTETMFYMTWGRKNGDASNCSSWPPVCTYEGMDSLLNLRYRTMAFDNNATVSPVGAVWNYIRQNYPSIELYQSDESHPSAAGSYAAACCFYSSIFRKDPETITYSYGLDSTTAASIRIATKTTEFNNTNAWYIGAYDPKADYSYINNGLNSVTFLNNSMNAVTYLWDFNDGSYSNNANPIHMFSTPGQYNVTLFSYKCGYSDRSTTSVTVLSTGISQVNPMENVLVYPNPASNFVEIRNSVPENLITKVEIVNTLGEILYSSNIGSASEFRIDTHQFPRGYYFISLTSKNNYFKSYPLVLN